MAQEAEAERGGSSIARASSRKLGYDTGQVDAFLNKAHALYDSDGAGLTQQDIQNVSFDLAKGGYDIAQVDAALSRLERAVVDRQTATQIAEQGRVAWRAQTEQLYRRIDAHAQRSEGERFAPGKKKQPSYDRKQVDSLINDAVDKAAAELGVDGADRKLAEDLKQVTAASVSNATFTQRKGPRGYDERQVDYFLNSCVQLLSRLESFSRVNELDDAASAKAASGPVAATVPASSAPSGQSGAVSPLFAAGNGQTAAPASFAPHSSDKESFDALHKAEQAIFTAPVPATPVASVPPAPVAAHVPETPATPAPVVPPAPVIPGGADSSLAELAHMAEASQEMDAPSAFHPHMPSLSTPAVTPVPPVEDASPAPQPASPVPVPADGEATGIIMPSAEPAAPSEQMPQSFAPAVKPQRSASHGRVSQSAAQAPAVSENVPQQVPATPEPQAEPQIQPDSIPSFAPAEMPQHESTRPAEPQTESAPAEQAKPEVVSPASAPDKNETVFPSLFPQVDTDIPDLSFPSLYGDDTKKHA
ncbi:MULTISPECIES: DivIVA domain-containing protein [Bifidobacterium]|uniref:DivIVA domain-containing protein n=1 Tax=Bifidobacterium TaxID=1678 RepID=UPI001BDCA17A|nr:MULTISPECIES: DivIVA domain-containing protein [Bifidobacterium]MBT1161148.1 DivIVA domain-containing protein [Bifidobacterium sp. SO1]MBW3078236.1 DivIVA domain-containing protein [Bifidobacterium simiiventris]